MTPQDLAKAVKDERLRNQVTEELSVEEASAFDEYVSDSTSTSATTRRASW